MFKELKHIKDVRYEFNSVTAFVVDNDETGERYRAIAFDCDRCGKAFVGPKVVAYAAGEACVGTETERECKCVYCVDCAFKKYPGTHVAMTWGSEAEMIVENYIVISDDRRNCCEPYDCMHHEGCGEEENGIVYRCGACSDYGDAWKEITDNKLEYCYSTIAASVEDSRSEMETFLHRQRRQDARDLEVVGDYAGANRLMGVDAFGFDLED